MTQNATFAQLKQPLVCPHCKAEMLEFSTKVIQCHSCTAQFTQAEDICISFISNQLLETDEVSQWQERLAEMEEWYQDLNSNAESANNCFLSDYRPYASFLKEISGDVLDIGGGIGLPRHYLPSISHYTVIDPSLKWLKTDWSFLTDNFPCLKQKPEFIQGVGEYLPFSAESFDAVLSFWSLNHANNPEMVFSEVARVLRPGGKFLLVLEDMIPQWQDLLNPMFPARNVCSSLFYNLQTNFLRKLFPRFYMAIRRFRQEPWPLQNDHVLILESDIKEWSKYTFDIKHRTWGSRYLSFELQKHN